MRHQSVDKVAVIPVPDDRLGEKVCIAVTLRPGASLAPETMLQHLDEVGLSKFDMPEFFIELTEIPLTPSGKILKRELVSWVEQGRVSPRPVRFKAKVAND
jgi:acyl-CoA synthetase